MATVNVSESRPRTGAARLLDASPLLRVLSGLGRYVLLMARAFAEPSELRRYRKDFFYQMVRLGVASLPIVMMASAFTGGVMTVQTIYQMTSPLMPASTVGAIVSPSMILELAALVTAFMLAGRVSARVAAELASMRVTEQIDALSVMGLSPEAYLVAPRVVAGVLTFPVLYVAACVVGIGAGAGVAGASDAVTAADFLQGAHTYFRRFDVIYGLIKSLVFGFAVTSVACYKGYYAHGGAQEVGESATRAAVGSCVFVLVADYLLAITLL